ncbi:ECF transporter S component [Floccifex sp.]|uniref:ECF transporter S component n=1 Tax=Floccifex sp. TaxID=2815810 RepID=UPI002A758B9A|nr:ECF transporter S component [Floccifex sp.]MDD7281750.1 ECF transporter S component [Erysipelotrichaceae bacterium]MDY2958625.1 ECF transporter S component [Floccifex sp.]
MNAKKISAIALAICINIIGAQIALTLRLPIYLDCIGTILIASLYGPIYGMIPHCLSGLIFFMMGDAFALYYAPVGIVLGLLFGILWKYKKDSLWSSCLITLLVVIPTSILSSAITAYLFGGITSSGSSIFVQLLKPILGLPLSCFVIQLITDYIDKLVGVLLVSTILKRMPERIKGA